MQADSHSSISATHILNEFNQKFSENTKNLKLWSVTYGFGKDQVLQIWSGHGENVRAAQFAFEHRSKVIFYLIIMRQL